jgi:hypothetical protein
LFFLWARQASSLQPQHQGHGQMWHIA